MSEDLEQLPIIVLGCVADDLDLDEGDRVVSWPLTPIVIWPDAKGRR